MYSYIFFFKLIYFIFGCIGSSLLRAGFLQLWCVGFLQLWRAGTTLRCGARASHCCDFSCCRARVLGAWASAVVAGGLQSAGSVVVAHGLSCSLACGIFPCPCIGRQILNHCATREALYIFFYAISHEIGSVLNLISQQLILYIKLYQSLIFP